MDENKIKGWPVAIVAFSIVLGLCSVFLRLTYIDEMNYVDPGAQLALQGRMVSTVWVTNSPDELWASSNPGLSLLFAGWFKIFGFGVIQSRILFLLLYLTGVSVFFIWIKNKFNPSRLALALGLSGFFILPSLVEPLYNLRVDVIALLLFTFFIYYTWTEKQNLFLNWLAPALLGFLVVLFGFHFALFFSLAAATAILLKRDKAALIRAIALLLGVAVGLVILRSVYIYYNMWDTLIAARASHLGKVLPWCPVGWKKLTLLSDWPLFISLATLGLICNLGSSRSKWLPWILAISVFLITPFIISSIGIYHRAYLWMVALPMVLCFYYAENLLKGWCKILSIIMISFSLILFSLYSISSLIRLSRDTQQINKVVNLVMERFPRGTSIIASERFYYHFVGRGFKYYFHVESSSGEALGFKQDHFFPKKHRDQVKCIIFSTGEGEPAKVISEMGGEWILIGSFPAPANGKLQTDITVYIKK
jgi:hypothetical protein